MHRKRRTRQQISRVLADTLDAVEQMPRPATLPAAGELDGAAQDRVTETTADAQRILRNAGRPLTAMSDAMEALSGAKEQSAATKKSINSGDLTKAAAARNGRQPIAPKGYQRS